MKGLGLVTKKHSYKNPSKARHDLAKVEAQVTEGKKYYNDQGWEILPPKSDRECIYRCLETVPNTHLQPNETIQHSECRLRLEKKKN